LLILDLAFPGLEDRTGNAKHEDINEEKKGDDGVYKYSTSKKHSLVVVEAQQMSWQLVGRAAWKSPCSAGNCDSKNSRDEGAILVY